MIRRLTIVFFLLLPISAGSVNAQHWKKVFSAPGLGSAACFINPDVGCIGLGNYPGGYPARIYYTTDGGKSWTQSLMPNMNIFGQVTDIFFVDRMNAWATVRERIEHGWSGIYKTIDGGKTWDLWFQAEFPVSVRQTSRALFFTDRYSGIKRSTDGGNTFQIVASSSGALGLDFLDDNIGISSSEGSANAPQYITFDGGANWIPYDIPHEGWTSYADVATGNLLFSSERNLNFSESALFVTQNKANFLQVFSKNVDAITGGIAGTRWCRSAIYVQGQDSNSKRPDVIGLLRSLDGGLNWVNVGGPSNFNDKRFGVTGKGAVVYAFDKSGGVWKTIDGGDGALTASALGRITLTPLTKSLPLSSKLCDSTDLSFQLQYSDCDSLIVTEVAFIDDVLSELQLLKTGGYFGRDNAIFDTISIRFKPKKVRTLSERIRIRLRQADGFLQDTVITLSLEGLTTPDVPFINEVKPGEVMDFGSHTICGDDSVRIVTITNAGCSPMNVSSLTISGSPFALLSSFSPFTLDPGISRKVLVQFKPTVIGAFSGTLTLVTGTANRVISLAGSGENGSRGYRLFQPPVATTLCDSTEGDIIFKNISCLPVRLDSIGVDVPFRFDPIGLPANIKTDSSITIHFHFVPTTDGTFSIPVTIRSFGGVEFDTVLMITGVATRGDAALVIDPLVLDFGSLTVCSSLEKEITISNPGCDALLIKSDSLMGIGSGHTIVQSAKNSTVLRGGSTKIVVRFKPPGVGNYSAILHLVTSLGDRDIPLIATGASDPGILSLAVTPVGSVLTCKDSGFALTLANTTCDSLTLDSIIFNGSASADYSVNQVSALPLSPGKVFVSAGRFIPQADGVRNATAHFYLHFPGGAMKEISVAMDGAGIQPVTILLSLLSGNLTAQAGSSLRLPVQLLDPSIIDVAGIKFSMALNTDLLEPQSFDMTGSVMSGANVGPLLITKTGVTIDLTFPIPQKLTVGLLGTLVLTPYVSDSLSTPITLTDFIAFDRYNTRECLPTAIVIPPQVVTSFSLNTECGEESLREYIRSGISGLLIENIVPNPTASQVWVTIRIPQGYTNDGVIEIFDVLGSRIQSEPLFVSDGENKVIRRIDLHGASGLRSVRVRTSKGVSSQSVYLMK